MTPTPTKSPKPITGRIDVHSHLLPGIDDGCPNIEESLACARELVRVGYTHCFCTPHVWPSLPDNTPDVILARTRRLQEQLDGAEIDLKVIPGGEMNLREDLAETPEAQIATYAMNGKYCLFDIWADRLPAFFWPAVKWLQSLNLKVVIAHPERMRAVQDSPRLAQEFADGGLLLQGNLQCLADPPRMQTRRLAEQYIKEGRYFMLGSDTHNLAGLRIRLEGLDNAIDLMGEAEILKLTRDNPSQLLPE